MGRKTYSFGAAALIAVASMSFPGVENAVAFAQDVAANATGNADAQTGPQAGQQAESTEDMVEIVPQQPVFVSEEVVQPLKEAATSETGNTDIEASSLRELVGIVDSNEQMTDQMRCLAGAVYFESRGEPLDGQLAVAQVVINRAEDGRWPASYCGVVYQRSQFSFVRGGRMPNINTSSAAWQRAKAVATIAHEGLWDSEAADAVYFHATRVRPSWSRRKTRLAQIDSHVFYR